MEIEQVARDNHEQKYLDKNIQVARDNHVQKYLDKNILSSFYQNHHQYKVTTDCAGTNKNTRQILTGRTDMLETANQIINQQIRYAAVNFCHNYPPPRAPSRFAPTLGLLHASFCPGGGDLLGKLQRGEHLSINDFSHFWNFHYDGKNWRLTTLWGLLVALKFYVLKRKSFNLRLNQS